MDILKAVVVIVVIVGIAFLLGKVDHHKQPELHAYSWAGSIVVLLIMWGCL